MGNSLARVGTNSLNNLNGSDNLSIKLDKILTTLHHNPQLICTIEYNELYIKNSIKYYKIRKASIKFDNGFNIFIEDKDGCLESTSLMYGNWTRFAVIDFFADKDVKYINVGPPNYIPPTII